MKEQNKVLSVNDLSINELINYFLNEAENQEKNILKNSFNSNISTIDNLIDQYRTTIINLYNNIFRSYNYNSNGINNTNDKYNDINDGYKLLIMKKIIVDNNTRNKLLLDVLIKDLGFDFITLLLHLINNYGNDYFLSKFDLFKEYIPYLDKIQLDELLIKSIKHNLNGNFINYLIDLRANRNILNKGINSNVSFFKNNRELFSVPISRTHERTRVLIQYLFEYFGHPEKKIKNVIHITGSNGKGTTSHILRNISQANGYKVNAFTCPFI